MEFEDIIISDLYEFFTSLSSITNDRRRLSNSIIPYLSFVIASNDRAYEYLIKKKIDWNSENVDSEYARCPWINCGFVTRMLDVEMEKRIINILLYVCSEETNDEDIYEIISAGWKRIALYVESVDVINVDEAPLRKKIEEKWALCLLAFIKNKIILQAQKRDYWYNFSSELFFYYEFIIQQADIDPLNDTTPLNVDYTSIENCFVNVSEDEIDATYIPVLYQLIKIKEKLIKNSVCSVEATHNANIEKTYSTKNEVYEKKEIEPLPQEKSDLYEYYENRISELERMNSKLISENLRLKQSVEVLSDEISFLRTVDDEDIILEDEYDIEYLYKKKIVICGGRIEWLNRIKQIFPNWKYIENDNVRFDGKVLKDSNIDAIVFNRRFVSHGLFYRVASQKNKDTPLIYIDSGNTEFAIQLICNKLKMLDV